MINERMGNRCRRGMARSVILAPIVVVVLAAAAFGLVSLRRGGSDNAAGDGAGEAPQWYFVRPESFDLMVVASGELEAKNVVELKCLVEGRTTITEIVDEGGFVKKGDVVVRLADDEINQEIEEEQLRVEEATADKVAAEQQLDIEKSEAASKLQEAQVKLELAELDLKKWKEGDVPKKERDLRLAMDKAKINLKRASDQYVLSMELKKNDFITDAELQDDEIKKLDAQNDYDSAQLEYKIYYDITYVQEQKQYQLAVKQARDELSRTKDKNASQLAKANSDLSSKTRSLSIHTDRLAKLKKQLAATVIRAPQDGLVVYATSGARGRRGYSSEPITQGREVRFNENIVTLPDTSQMVAVLKVHEAMLNEVKEGQEVSVQINARPGAPIRGTISQIAVMPNDGGWLNPTLREYDVRVDLPPVAQRPDLDGLKPAMRCTGRIMLGRVESAIAVPIQAVFTHGRQHFCYVPASRGKVEPREVKIGRSSETMVEIVEGLKQNDRVLLRQPRPGEVTSASLPASPKSGNHGARG